MRDAPPYMYFAKSRGGWGNRVKFCHDIQIFQFFTNKQHYILNGMLPGRFSSFVILCDQNAYVIYLHTHTSCDIFPKSTAEWHFNYIVCIILSFLELQNKAYYIKRSRITSNLQVVVGMLKLHWWDKSCIILNGVGYLLVIFIHVSLLLLISVLFLCTFSYWRISTIPMAIWRPQLILKQISTVQLNPPNPQPCVFVCDE